jgi:hypothetical protein
LQDENEDSLESLLKADVRAEWKQGAIEKSGPGPGGRGGAEGKRGGERGAYEPTVAQKLREKLERAMATPPDDHSEKDVECHIIHR